jgi:hypothetical protein
MFSVSQSGSGGKAMFAQRVSLQFYRLVSRLSACRLARDYAEYHGSAEDSYVARIGPVHLEINDCFVLDHADASMSLQLRAPWGRVTAGIMACLGEEQVRRPGLFVYRYSF